MQKGDDVSSEESFYTVRSSRLDNDRLPEPPPLSRRAARGFPIPPSKRKTAPATMAPSSSSAVAVVLMEEGLSVPASGSILGRKTEPEFLRIFVRELHQYVTSTNARRCAFARCLRALAARAEGFSSHLWATAAGHRRTANASASGGPLNSTGEGSHNGASSQREMMVIFLGKACKATEFICVIAERAGLLTEMEQIAISQLPQRELPTDELMTAGRQQWETLLGPFADGQKENPLIPSAFGMECSRIRGPVPSAKMTDKIWEFDRFQTEYSEDELSWELREKLGRGAAEIFENDVDCDFDDEEGEDNEKNTVACSWCEANLSKRLEVEENEEVNKNRVKKIIKKIWNLFTLSSIGHYEENSIEWGWDDADYDAEDEKPLLTRPFYIPPKEFADGFQWFRHGFRDFPPPTVHLMECAIKSA